MLRVSSQIHHDHTHVVGAVSGQSQFGEQHRRVRACFVGNHTGEFVLQRRRKWRRVRFPTQAHTRHPTRGVV